MPLSASPSGTPVPATNAVSATKADSGPSRTGSPTGAASATRRPAVPGHRHRPELGAATPLAFLFLLFIPLLLPQAAAAEPRATPVGLWRTIDDATGQAKSYVRVSRRGGADGELTAVIDSLLPEPGKDAARVCGLCPGDKKNLPLRGLEIAWGLQGSGKAYDGGYILDPGNGKTYRCKMEVSDDGLRLTVRGFIGISLIGRSQTWHRVPDTASGEEP